MQFVMSVSVVSMVSWCGVAVFLGAMYMLAMVMSLKCFVCIFRSCISVLSVLMVCGVLMCVNVVHLYYYHIIRLIYHTIYHTLVLLPH